VKISQESPAQECPSPEGPPARQAAVPRRRRPRAAGDPPGMRPHGGVARPGRAAGAAGRPSGGPRGTHPPGQVL